MYEYTPKTTNKTREKLWMSAFLILAAAAYGVSGFLPYPALLQISAVVCLTVGVLIISRFLLRSYVYRILPSADGTGVDLTVTEIMGKKRTVVCRVAVSDLRELIPLTEWKQKKPTRGSGISVWRFVSEMRPADGCWLCVEGRDGRFWMEICADETMIALLNDAKKQYLSDIEPPLT